MLAIAMRQLAEYFTECANQPPVPGLRVPTPTRKLLALGPKLLNQQEEEAHPNPPLLTGKVFFFFQKCLADQVRAESDVGGMYLNKR